MAGNGVTFPTLRTAVGVAKENTKGTAVATPTLFLPVRQFDADPKQVKLKDQNWRGSMGDLYGLQNGPRSAELSIAGEVFVDTIPMLLKGVLGDCVNTGAGPYINTIGLLNSGDGQPTSYTFVDTQGGLQTRSYQGAQITEVTLKFDAAGFLNYDAKATSFIGATASNPTTVYSTTIPVAGWLGALTIGGTAVTNVQSAEIMVKRNNAEAIFTVGSQDPYNVHVGGIEVTTKLTFVAQDESPLLAYLAGTQSALVATFTQGASAALAMTMTQHQYETAKVTRGKSYMEVETTGVAILNSTDAGASGGLSPLKAICTNNVAVPTF